VPTIDIQTALRELKVKKVTGVDGIPSRLLIFGSSFLERHA
jgi:hypothetical protein